MSDWTNSHDLVYAFVCVSFLADGDVDESEKEAMRGNVKVMLPDMGDDEYHQVEKEVIDKWNEWKLDVWESNRTTWNQRDQAIAETIDQILLKELDDRKTDD